MTFSVLLNLWYWYQPYNIYLVQRLRNQSNPVLHLIKKMRIIELKNYSRAQSFSQARGVSSKDRLHSIVPLVNSNVFYTETHADGRSRYVLLTKKCQKKQDCMWQTYVLDFILQKDWRGKIRNKMVIIKFVYLK